MATGARDVLAIDRATGRRACGCDRPLWSRDEADEVLCVKCGRPLMLVQPVSLEVSEVCCDDR